MKNNTITDVFFDLDHTLWDFDRNSSLAFQLVFQQHKIEIELERFLEVYTPINYDYWKAYREERVTKEQLRRGRLEDSFTALNHKIAVNVIDAMSISYIDFLPENNFLLEGALEILDYLAPKYNLHIITNGFTEVQNIKMERSNLAQYFKTVTSSESVGVKKPNSRVFHHALQVAKTRANKSIMIGDSFEADVLGAEKVGMETVFYNFRKAEHPKGYKTIDALLELKEVL